MNIDSVLKLIEEEFAPAVTTPTADSLRVQRVAMVGDNLEVTEVDIPDFLLVANRVPLSAEQRAKLDAIKTEHPSIEEKWQRNRRLYEAEGERQKLLTAEKAKPAAQAYFAKKKAEAAEIKAVKDAAKAAHRK